MRETTGYGMDEATRHTYAWIALAVVLVTLAEGVVRTFVLRKPYDARAGLASLVLAIGRRVFDHAPLWLTLPLASFFFEHRLVAVRQDAWWSWALLFFGLELAHYASHRASHRMRWLWASHAVHHSSAELTLAAAYRLGWTGRISFALAFFSPLALLGFAPDRILSVYTLTLLYQVWLHAAWIPRLGPLEGVFNTPSAHRVHHGNAAPYRDKNFGGVLVLFDRLFGTYAAERDDVATTYGWASPALARRPLRVLVIPYRELFAHIRRARGPRQLVGAFFGPPDEAPEPLG